MKRGIEAAGRGVRVRIRDVTKQDLDAMCRVLWGQGGHASTAEFLLAGA